MGIPETLIDREHKYILAVLIINDLWKVHNESIFPERMKMACLRKGTIFYSLLCDRSSYVETQLQVRTSLKFTVSCDYLLQQLIKM